MSENETLTPPQADEATEATETTEASEANAADTPADEQAEAAASSEETFEARPAETPPAAKSGQPPLSATAAAPQQSSFDAGVPLLDRLELPVEIRFGKLVWKLSDVLDMRIGDALPIGPEDDDAVTLYVQGRPYARGDLVVVDDRFGFRVTAIISEDI